MSVRASNVEHRKHLIDLDTRRALRLGKGWMLLPAGGFQGRRSRDLIERVATRGEHRFVLSTYSPMVTSAMLYLAVPYTEFAQRLDELHLTDHGALIDIWNQLSHAFRCPLLHLTSPATTAHLLQRTTPGWIEEGDVDYAFAYELAVVPRNHWVRRRSYFLRGLMDRYLYDPQYARDEWWLRVGGFEVDSAQIAGYDALPTSVSLRHIWRASTIGMSAADARKATAADVTFLAALKGIRLFCGD
jgi:hypothetical protein